MAKNTPSTPNPDAAAGEDSTDLPVKRLRAVHGDIVHYKDGTRFETDSGKKHELDAWCRMQVEHGKLAVDEE